VLPIAIAMLTGAAIDCLRERRGERRLLWGVGGAALAVAAVIRFAHSGGRAQFVGWAPVITVVVALIVVAAVLAARTSTQNGAGVLPIVAATLLVITVIAQPAGLELTGSWLGWPEHRRLQRIWNADESGKETLLAYTSDTDLGGAGEFLQARLAEGEPFRYLGYAGLDYPGDEDRAGSYGSRPFAPYLIAILVNGRPFFLELEEIQGYNPVQLRRYAEFITAVNGEPMDYHYLYVTAAGTASPLLDLLNLRYVVIDASLPPNREDVVALTTGRNEVFRSDEVVIFEDPEALPRAWIVHDARQVERGAALPLLTSGQIDPRQTALVEGGLPADSAPPDSTGGDSTVVTHWEPDALTIAVEASAPGLLVVSENYASGWSATVDGTDVEILPTDHTLRGIPIPAGSYNVELRFSPPGMRAGMVISLLAIAAMIATFAVAGWGWVAGRRKHAP
jgi:hypothetical protein